MVNVIAFTSRAKNEADKRKIVLALVVYDCLAKFHEFGTEAEFLPWLKSAAVQAEKMPPEQFASSYWWACAFLYARRNQIDCIDRDFCRRFDIDTHHAATLAWAEKYLAGLPQRYAELLRGAP